MNTPLTDLIPPGARRWIYGAYVLAGIAAGAAQVALEPDPTWLVKAVDVLAYLSVPIGGLAVSNVATPAADDSLED